MIQDRRALENIPIPHARAVGLDAIGLRDLRAEHWNLSAPKLIEEAIKRQEGWLSNAGAFIAHTGTHTGRSAKDKFVVRGPIFGPEIWWESPYQHPLEGDHFDALWADLIEHYRGRDAFVLDAWAGADPTFRMAVRVITENAWHNHFARNLFIPANPEEARSFEPEFSLISAPSFKASPRRHGSRSETMIAISLKRRLVLIVGTSYAGEIKKSIFTILNHLLPTHHVMPMHCSANIGPDGDVALFFGMSGTGKTTLSADPTRGLIGDDEHGWTEHGVFNFEGGCYAKVINLSPEAEPEIHRTTRTFGTVLENVVFDDETRELDLENATLTENTRAAYPLSQISNAVIPSVGGHPRHIVFLAADAFGVLPPIAKLTPEQAMYYFLCGYTAKVAGTEKGVTEPQASFETAFGAPFLTRPPQVYANLLREKIEQHDVGVWLVNTGWTGGPYGVGSRIKLAYTRAMVHAALEGKLDSVSFQTHPVFGLQVPSHVDGVPDTLVDPRATWNDKAAYDAQAVKLAGMFRAFFEQFEQDVSEAVRNAGPKGQETGRT
jgi:phosphoenolpyruvate carboxykinase (ATP)